MIIVRFILIIMIVYLLVRGFVRSFYLEDKPDPSSKKDTGKGPGSKRISKKVGEYVDYEEIDD